MKSTNLIRTRSFGLLKTAFGSPRVPGTAIRDWKPGITDLAQGRLIKPGIYLPDIMKPSINELVQQQCGYGSGSVGGRNSATYDEVVSAQALHLEPIVRKLALVSGLTALRDHAFQAGHPNQLKKGFACSRHVVAIADRIAVADKLLKQASQEMRTCGRIYSSAEHMSHQGAASVLPMSSLLPRIDSPSSRNAPAPRQLFLRRVLPLHPVCWGICEMDSGSH